MSLRLCSHLVPKHCARVQFLLVISVITPFFKYSKQNLGIVPMLGNKVLTLHPGSKKYLGLWIAQCVNATLFCAGAQKNCEHSL